MSVYQKRKAAAREFAQEWQAEFSENSYSWGEIAEYSELFDRIGRRYGLLREFRENGII